MGSNGRKLLQMIKNDPNKPNLWFWESFVTFLKKFSEKKQNFLKIISFGLLGSFLIILSNYRPFDPILEQNKFRKAEKIKIFTRNFWPLGVGKAKFH